MGRGFHILTYPFDSLSFPHFILNVVSLLHRPDLPLTLVSVFHRILDFKTGLNFYSGPFFCTNFRNCTEWDIIISVYAHTTLLTYTYQIICTDFNTTAYFFVACLKRSTMGLMLF